jgi:hypothetical protein
MFPIVEQRPSLMLLQFNAGNVAAMKVAGPSQSFAHP